MNEMMPKYEMHEFRCNCGEPNEPGVHEPAGNGHPCHQDSASRSTGITIMPTKGLTAGYTIAEIQRRVYKTAAEHGWWDGHAPQDFNVPEKLMLIVSEVSEAMEEIRRQDSNAAAIEIVNGKPEGFVVELADAVIRIMDLCEHMGLDLESAILLKAAYNDTRPYKHGNKKF
jgi:NTP pyrophosphatase (non-canonical NTP hydrolase)